METGGAPPTEKVGWLALQVLLLLPGNMGPPNPNGNKANPGAPETSVTTGTTAETRKRIRAKMRRRLVGLPTAKTRERVFSDLRKKCTKQKLGKAWQEEGWYPCGRTGK